ncbi:slr1659 superfamily regulator [Aphanothece sacrum]|uniref:Anti-sigma B factor antagonist n=1 Tax=Aphanothece sacrum FPU1 TaxID=1920663 RepID=A0A401IKV5_APHSA|nr:STAS domain-containing protein [Aphanothece sacrum]GBF81877.1 anti-sigma B factor antagonist [Aphanothece sacrum FPU1]GBF83506.1 anti-sigma B factor antagonist [Aphanothece sacrum FPU3]
MNITTEGCTIDYDSETVTVSFKGSLRLSGMEEYQPIVDLLNNVVQEDKPVITLDLKGLEFLNSSGISMLSKFVINVRKKGSMVICVKGSKAIAWQDKSLKNLQRLMPTLTLEFE